MLFCLFLSACMVLMYLSYYFHGKLVQEVCRIIISFSAVSDGENGYRNNLLRKSSSKTTVPPQSPLYDELIGLSQEYAKYKRIVDLVKGRLHWSLNSDS